MYSEYAVRVKNLSKCYQIYDTPRDRLKQFVVPRIKHVLRRQQSNYFSEFWALKDVSFEIKRGETLGIIGRNGSGKSTLLQILAGTLAPTGGEVQIYGRIAALLELGSGFNPEFTGRENVFLNGQVLGLSQKEIEARYEQIAGFADIGDFIKQPVKTYSSGMYVRLAFAVQAHIDASIVIIDEALAVGDVFFRQKCYTRLEQLRKSGSSILLVSHSMPDIEQYCKRAILLDQGVPQFIGPASEATKYYYLLHQKGNKEGHRQDNVPIMATAERGVNPSIEHPPAEAFFDLTNKTQISNGQASCIGVAVCNSAGEPCNSFRQGEVVIFYYIFEILEAIDVPICGLVIKNDRGVIVHGKNNWQFENDVPADLEPGSKILCQQKIKLDIAPGEYIYEIGLASVSKNIWARRERIPHEELSVRRVRNCHIADAGSFSVGLAIKNGIPRLTHHGISNLPGEMAIAVERGISQPKIHSMDKCLRGNQRSKIQEEQPTLFHITHWKAGSQWIYKILQEIVPERIVVPMLDEKQFLDEPLVRAAVYPTIYVTKEQFHSVKLPDNYRKFIIIRDLRDTLISGYFSVRYSHVIINQQLAQWREQLKSLTIEAGLLMLMEEWLPMPARIQESWIEAGERIIRYEDLLETDFEILEELFIGHCQIPITPEKLRAVIIANRFENLTGGRKPGEENKMAHERKGIAGDWRNFFTPRLTEIFNDKYGSILLNAGYIFSD